MINLDVIPQFKWTLRYIVSGETTADFNFGHITDEPTWVRKIEGRIATDPCTGDRTLIGRLAPGTIPKRRGPLTMYFGQENNNTPDQNLAFGLQLFSGGGPYTLITPKGVTFDILFDYETDWREQRIDGAFGAYKVVVGVAEV